MLKNTAPSAFSLMRSLKYVRSGKHFSRDEMNERLNNPWRGNMTLDIVPDKDCEECNGKGVYSVPFESWGDALTKEYYCDCVTNQLSEEQLKMKDAINLILPE